MLKEIVQAEAKQMMNHEPVLLKYLKGKKEGDQVTIEPMPQAEPPQLPQAPPGTKSEFLKAVYELEAEAKAKAKAAQSYQAFQQQSVIANEFNKKVLLKIKSEPPEGTYCPGYVLAGNYSHMQLHLFHINVPSDMGLGTQYKADDTTTTGLSYQIEDVPIWHFNSGEAEKYAKAKVKRETFFKKPGPKKVPNVNFKLNYWGCPVCNVLGAQNFEQSLTQDVTTCNVCKMSFSGLLLHGWTGGDDLEVLVNFGVNGPEDITPPSEPRKSINELAQEVLSHLALFRDAIMNPTMDLEDNEIETLLDNLIKASYEVPDEYYPDLKPVEDFHPEDHQSPGSKGPL